MLSSEEALQKLFDLVKPLGKETVTIANASGRILRDDCAAKHPQPSFSMSAMDGYALASKDIKPNAKLKVIGESAAGHPSQEKINSGESIRIFTGAAIPEGADKVVIQEQVLRKNEYIEFKGNIDQSTYIRPAGSDFKKSLIFKAPKLITPYDVMLLASMGHSKLNVSKRPIISIISTGDELIPPSTEPKFGQIICSNSYGIKAMLEENGAITKILPIAKDNVASLETAFQLAKNSDIVITTGGASVGDHDLVKQVAKQVGIKPSFYKVAMRPGKPLMAGKCNSFIFVGLPGNPVSSMICSQVFLKPMINKMLGLKYEKTKRTKYPLANALKKNGSREHYMRAHLKNGKVTVQINQDSASTSILQSSNALVVRPPHDQCREKNDLVEVIRL